MAYRYMTVNWGAVASHSVTPEYCDDHWNPPKRKPEKRGGDSSFRCSIDGRDGSTGRFGRLTAPDVCTLFDKLFAAIVKREVARGCLIQFSNGADCVCLPLAAGIWPRFPAITAVFAYGLDATKVSFKTKTGLESAKFKLFGEKKKGTIKHV